MAKRCAALAPLAVQQCLPSAHAACSKLLGAPSAWLPSRTVPAALWPQRGFSSSTAAGDEYRPSPAPTRSTTVLCVRKGGEVVLIADGQVTLHDQVIVKPNARKIRRIGGSVMAGFAGSAADGMSLLERLETKLEEHPGQLTRAAVELAKLWRQDKMLRLLQAQLLVADAQVTMLVQGNGDVLQPHDGVMAIGSGGIFAESAARALLDIEGWSAMEIAKKSMKIAADSCVFTNHEWVWDSIETDGADANTPKD